ncbi:hypothetical protein FRX31_005403 [Thalictrum thalictroides]|uniref:Ubiquitin-like domain-containing protein n=1 Tax=Thalictrum thalictroides TaxID=46969 RepID=A0A7J6X6H6_THATH|nr:hypothetical protein FRX31_005403 [Thalictrum thalictroides]
MIRLQGYLQIMYSLDEGHLHRINQEMMRTVRDLRLYIQQHYHIPINDQILFNNYNVLVNNDRDLVDVLEPHSGAAVRVYTRRPPQMYNFHVFVEGDEFAVLFVEAHSTDTVLYLKERIDEKYGISPHRQKIVMIGLDPMHDWEVLDNYIVEDFPKVYLEKIPIDQEKVLRIRIKENESFTNVEVEKDDTIYTLHGIARNKGLASAIDKFYFLWVEEKLLGTTTFASYDIPNQSTLSFTKVEEEEGKR